jgi:predicted dehydrogenase
MASEGTAAPVRWGLLGTGDITNKVVRGARRSGRVEFVAVGSRTAGRARDYAASHDVPREHGSYEALLDDPDVEAVYISLPNSLHHEWTMHALRAGKHVLCEKPYSTRVADVDEAYDLAESRNLVLSEGFMWRHHPQAATLKAQLLELGELQTIRATFAFVLGPDRANDIRLRADLEGGSLMDVGCYCVSGARFLAGEEPEAVYGRAAWGPTGVDLRFTGVLRFPSGVMAEFTSAFTMDHRGLEPIGDEGSAMLVDPWQADPATLVLRGEVVARWHPEDPSPMEVPYFHEFENFSAAVRGEADVLLGRDHAVGQARVLGALYESARTGREIALD